MRENISQRKMGMKVMKLYFAVLMEFGTCPGLSLPLSILMLRGPPWPLPLPLPLPLPSPDSLWPFLLPCMSSVFSTLSATWVYCPRGFW